MIVDLLIFSCYSDNFCFVYEVAMNAGYDCHIFLVKYFSSYHIKFYSDINLSNSFCLAFAWYYFSFKHSDERVELEKKKIMVSLPNLTTQLLKNLKLEEKTIHISLTFKLSNFPVTLQSCIRHLYGLSPVQQALVPGFLSSVRPPQRKSLPLDNHLKFIIIIIDPS